MENQQRNITLVKHCVIFYVISTRYYSTLQLTNIVSNLLSFSLRRKLTSKNKHNKNYYIFCTMAKNLCKNQSQLFFSCLPYFHFFYIIFSSAPSDVCFITKYFYSSSLFIPFSESCITFNLLKPRHMLYGNCNKYLYM